MIFDKLFYVGVNVSNPNFIEHTDSIKRYEKGIDEELFLGLRDKIFAVGEFTHFNEELRAVTSQISETKFRTGDAEYFTIGVFTPIAQEIFKNNASIVEFLSDANKYTDYLNENTKEGIMAVFYISAPKKWLSKELYKQYKVVNLDKSIYFQVTDGDNNNVGSSYDPIVIKEHIKTLKVMNIKGENIIYNSVLFEEIGIKKSVKCYDIMLDHTNILEFLSNYKGPSYLGVTSETVISLLSCADDTSLKYHMYIPVELYHTVLKELDKEENEKHYIAVYVTNINTQFADDKMREHLTDLSDIHAHKIMIEDEFQAKELAMLCKKHNFSKYTSKNVEQDGQIYTILRFKYVDFIEIFKNIKDYKYLYNKLNLVKYEKYKDTILVNICMSKKYLDEASANHEELITNYSSRNVYDCSQSLDVNVDENKEYNELYTITKQCFDLLKKQKLSNKDYKKYAYLARHFKKCKEL